MQCNSLSNFHKNWSSLITKSMLSSVFWYRRKESNIEKNVRISISVSVSVDTVIKDFPFINVSALLSLWSLFLLIGFSLILLSWSRKKVLFLSSFNCLCSLVTMNLFQTWIFSHWHTSIFSLHNLTCYSRNHVIRTSIATGYIWITYKCLVQKVEEDLICITFLLFHFLLFPCQITHLKC